MFDSSREGDPRQHAGLFFCALDDGRDAGFGRPTAMLAACAAVTFSRHHQHRRREPTRTETSMAPISAYLMDRGQEIAVARSASPNSI